MTELNSVLRSCGSEFQQVSRTVTPSVLQWVGWFVWAAGAEAEVQGAHHAGRKPVLWRAGGHWPRAH